MATYLVVKGENANKSYAVKSSAAHPYLNVSTGYLPLTTESGSSGLRLKAEQGTQTSSETRSYTTHTVTTSTSGNTMIAIGGDEDICITQYFTKSASYTNEGTLYYSYEFTGRQRIAIERVLTNSNITHEVGLYHTYESNGSTFFETSDSVTCTTVRFNGKRAGSVTIPLVVSDARDRVPAIRAFGTSQEYTYTTGQTSNSNSTATIFNTMVRQSIWERGVTVETSKNRLRSASYVITHVAEDIVNTASMAWYTKTTLTESKTYSVCPAYRIVESYTTTQSVETSRSSEYETTRSSQYDTSRSSQYDTSRSSQYDTSSTNTYTYLDTTVSSSSSTYHTAKYAATAVTNVVATISAAIVNGTQMSVSWTFSKTSHVTHRTLTEYNSESNTFVVIIYNTYTKNQTTYSSFVITKAHTVGGIGGSSYHVNKSINPSGLVVEAKYSMANNYVPSSTTTIYDSAYIGGGNSYSTYTQESCTYMRDYEENTDVETTLVTASFSSRNQIVSTSGRLKYLQTISKATDVSHTSTISQKNDKTSTSNYTSSRSSGYTSSRSSGYTDSRSSAYTTSRSSAYTSEQTITVDG